MTVVQSFSIAIIIITMKENVHYNFLNNLKTY